MTREIRNLSASVRQRLFNRAKETHRPFDELLQYFAMERFLYRLSRSPYKEKVVLKGALMFVAWDAPLARATRDIDLLGKMENDARKIEDMIRQACRTPVEPDGIAFDPSSVSSDRIKEGADYEGVRIRFSARLGQARVPMQIDLGFGDTVSPGPAEIVYPSILGMPRPRLKGYPRETATAEKFQAMVELGELNSRIKDFYDIYILARQFDFDGETLREALVKTFANRKTLIHEKPIAFSASFAANPEKTLLWSSFLRRASLDRAPKDFTTVIKTLRDFLLPIAKAALKKEKTSLIWKAPGPWRE